LNSWQQSGRDAGNMCFDADEWNIFLKKNNVIRRYQAGKITEFAIEKYN